MSRIIIACAVSLAAGLATGLTLRPVSSPRVAAEGLAPAADLAHTTHLAADPDSGRDSDAPRIRGSFHPLM